MAACKHNALDQILPNAGPSFLVLALTEPHLGQCLILDKIRVAGEQQSKHETFTQCRFNVGPASTTLAQH